MKKWSRASTRRDGSAMNGTPVYSRLATARQRLHSTALSAASTARPTTTIAARTTTTTTRTPAATATTRFPTGSGHEPSRRLSVNVKTFNDTFTITPSGYDIRYEIFNAQNRSVNVPDELLPSEKEQMVEKCRQWLSKASTDSAVS